MTRSPESLVSNALICGGFTFFEFVRLIRFIVLANDRERLLLYERRIVLVVLLWLTEGRTARDSNPSSWQPKKRVHCHVISISFLYNFAFLVCCVLSVRGDWKTLVDALTALNWTLHTQESVTDKTSASRKKALPTRKWTLASKRKMKIKNEILDTLRDFQNYATIKVLNHQS